MLGTASSALVMDDTLGVWPPALQPNLLHVPRCALHERHHTATEVVICDLASQGCPASQLTNSRHGLPAISGGGLCGAFHQRDSQGVPCAFRRYVFFPSEHARLKLPGRSLLEQGVDEAFSDSLGRQWEVTPRTECGWDTTGCAWTESMAPRAAVQSGAPCHAALIGEVDVDRSWSMMQEYRRLRNVTNA